MTEDGQSSVPEPTVRNRTVEAGIIAAWNLIWRADGKIMPKTWTALSLWSDMWTSGMNLTAAGLKFGEMMGASAHVFGSRCGSIAEAARNPVGGDYAELGRMVPEKVDAFSRAGRSALADLYAIHTDAVANWMQLGTIMAAGRLPTSAEAARMTGRSSRLGSRAAASAGKALAPVHRRATANAKRLRRKKRH